MFHYLQKEHMHKNLTKNRGIHIKAAKKFEQKKLFQLVSCANVSPKFDEN